MNVSLVQAAAALTANSRWEEMVAENLSSSSIPGFRKNNLSFSGVQAGLMAPTGPGQAGSGDKYIMPKLESRMSFEAGLARYTGEKTDMSIDGPGFFEIQMPNGKAAYTRSGSFQINSQGQLVTSSGRLVMGDSGPIQLDSNNPKVMAVAPTGEVSQGNDVKGKVKLVDFNDAGRLTAISGGLFMANDPKLQVTEAPSSTLRQFYVEGSNTTPAKEMINLISAMRTYEANQRVIQINDERMGRAISELGNPV